MKQFSFMNRITIILIISSILSGYFAITDLQISILVVDKSSGWATFLEKFGEIPGLLVLLSALYIYQARINLVSNKKNIIVLIIFFLASLFIVIYVIIVVYRGLMGNYDLLEENIIIFLTAALAANLIIIFGIKNIKLGERVITFAKLTTLLGLYGYLLLVQPFKVFWGRIRFRDLDPLYESFTGWFIPNGITGNESFPSGHSAMGWMLLPLLILFSKSEIKQRILLAIISVWALTVGISRVVIGAHFASDVLFGALFIIIVYIFLNKHYLPEQL
jgi:membrane-associated phospholipid phosphatase